MRACFGLSAHPGNQRIGKFLETQQGTLFLEEIGDLPLDTQGKLLRASQDRAIDVRLIAATSQNLISLVNQRRFLVLLRRVDTFDVLGQPVLARKDGHGASPFLGRRARRDRGASLVARDGTAQTASDERVRKAGRSRWR